MVGSNTTISSYRLTTASSKDTYSGTPTLNGVPVNISLEKFERAVYIDQENALLVYRLESDEDLNIQESDKVVDSQPTPATYIVHTVIKEPRDFAIGTRTVCILKKKRS
jgi:hypothetical protein